MVVNGAGQWVAICEGRKRGGGDSGDIDTVFKIGLDGGKAWGPLSVMWDGSTNTCGKPWVVRDAETGVSWVLHSWNRGDDHEPQIINQGSEDTRRGSEPERFVETPHRGPNSVSLLRPLPEGSVFKSSRSALQCLW
jgi:hypothetical protein